METKEDLVNTVQQSRLKIIVHFTKDDFTKDEGKSLEIKLNVDGF